MQNDDNIALASVLRVRVRNTLRKALGEPKVVLFVVGGSGFLIDLWKPIPVIGFALLVLATAPWILQAFQQRSRDAIKAVEVDQSRRADQQAIEPQVAVDLPEKMGALRRPAGEGQLTAAMPQANVTRAPPKSSPVQQAPRAAAVTPARQAPVPTALHDRPPPRRVPQTPTTTPGAA